MAIYIDFDKDFNNTILVEINRLLEKKDDINIDLDDFKELWFENEILNLKKLNIIDYKTNKLNNVKYEIFRKYIKSEPIDWIKASDIKQCIEKLEKEKKNYKEILISLKEYWFDIKEVKKDYIFNNNNTIQIRALIIIFWKELYNKLLKKWTYLNKDNGKVYYNWEYRWIINLNTNKFKLFEYLYDNIWIFKTHLEIKKEWIWTKIISGTDQQYISGIKKDLEEPIKKLIEAQSHGYIIKN